MALNYYSIIAYNKIEKTGILKGLRLAVLKCIAENPGITAAEAAEKTGIKINSISGRFSELKRAGLIELVQTKFINANCHGGYMITEHCPDKSELKNKTWKKKYLELKKEYNKLIAEFTKITKNQLNLF